MSKHHFSLLLFMIIKKYFPPTHYKRRDMFRWIILIDKDYYGVLFCVSKGSIKIYLEGDCIQYFTSLKSFEDWVKNGCTKQTVFMSKGIS